MVPAAPGSGLTVIGKLAEITPLPQALIPLTVRLPEVALVEKLPVMEFPVPVDVKPVPE